MADITTSTFILRALTLSGALLVLGACGADAGTDTVGADAADTVAPIDTASPEAKMAVDAAAGAAAGGAKVAPEPTTTIAVDDSLGAVHEKCTGRSTMREFRENQRLVGDIYYGMFAELAHDESMTEEAYVRKALEQMYDKAEETLSIERAWAEDDEYGMDPYGLLSGIVYDCVLDSLDIPSRVLDHIGHTRALDGMQTDSWDDYEARWNYHPDNGMSITIWHA